MADEDKNTSKSLTSKSSTINTQNTHIETPKRASLLLSPSALVQIGASPSSKRHSLIRKIGSEKKNEKIHASARKLSFLK